MTQPITYFVQNDPVNQLANTFGSHLEGLSREHRLSLIHALTTALLSEGSLEAYLLDVEELCDIPLPNELC